MPTKKQTQKNKERIAAARNVFDYLSAQSVEKIEKGGAVEATVYAVFYPPEEEHMVVFPVPIPTGEDADPETRRSVMSLLGKFLSEKGVDALMFIFVTEAWSSKQDPEKGEIIAPSKDPKREEILMVSAKDINTEERFSVFTIDRKGPPTLKKTNLFGVTDFLEIDSWKVETKRSPESLLDSAWEGYLMSNKKKLSYKKVSKNIA